MVDDRSQALLYARDLAQLYALRRVYEHLLPEPLDESASALPEPAVRQATVLLTDLRGFTLLAESFVGNPTGLLGMLNEHLAVVVDAIVASGGVVEKFLGDGVLASFGARRELPQHELCAVGAALGAQHANEVLNKKREGTWGFRLPMGIGIAAGPLVVGPIGPPHRCEMGILGDAINIASRLVAQAQAGEIRLTAAVYHSASGYVQAQPMGRIRVRGHAARVPVYRLNVGQGLLPR